MPVRTLVLDGFRSYEHLEIAFSDGPHVVVGRNAAGKTNLVEALVLLSTGRSHRSASDPEVVRWGLEYEWQNIAADFSATTTIYAEESMTDEADKHQMTAFAAITGTGKTISSMLVCRLFRNSSHANDTYDNGTALALLLEVDFHYELDTVGSRQITTK